MHKAQKVKFAVDKNADFFVTLRKRVQLYFDETKQSKQGNSSLYVKTVILYSLYIIPFLLILFSGWPGWVLLLLCIPMGLGSCGLGVNVMHDALHQSYATSKLWNRIMGATMEILGASSITWKIQHNMMHHTFTNVYGMDEDVDDKPFIRMSPDGKLHKYHQYQHLYAPVLYGFSNASWLIQKDFVQFIRYWKNGILKQVGVQPLKGLASLITTKTLFFGIVIGLPIIMLPFAWYWTVIGFLLVQFVSGLLMTLIFLTAHAVGETEHFQPDAEGNIENNWAIHQVLTTANFATRNPLWNWYVGGLNHQIEHHLFPQISHVHYAALAPIVRKTANEFGLEYKEYPSFFSALGAHFHYLKDIGKQPDTPTLA